MQQLLLKIEPQIIKLLKSHRLITSDSKSFSDYKTSPNHVPKNRVSDKWIQKWRKLWPAYQRGNMSVIRKKVNRFVTEHDYSLDEIYRATERWITMQSEPKYAGSADYFFYKRVKDGKDTVTISRALTTLEEEDLTEDIHLHGGELL